MRKSSTNKNMEKDESENDIARNWRKFSLGKLEKLIAIDPQKIRKGTRKQKMTKIASRSPARLRMGRYLFIFGREVLRCCNANNPCNYYHEIKLPNNCFYDAEESSSLGNWLNISVT